MSAGVKGLCLSDFMDIKIRTWNARGLGNRDKRIVVHKGYIGVFRDILIL